MTLHHTVRRTPAAPAPTLEALAAEAVRLGREAAAAASDVGVGVTPQDWRRVERLLEPLAERVPFEATDEDLAEARRILERNIDVERDGTERRVVDYDVDPDGRRIDVLAEVPAHTERGCALIEVRARLDAFLAARGRVLDAAAAERAVRALMGGAEASARG